MSTQTISGYEQQLKDKDTPLHTLSLAMSLADPIPSDRPESADIIWLRKTSIITLPTGYFDIIFIESEKRFLDIFAVRELLNINGTVIISNFIKNIKVCIGATFSLNVLSQIVSLLTADRYTVKLEQGNFWFVKIPDNQTYLKENVPPILFKGFKKPILFRGFKNVTGFTCYMDSILFSILVYKDGYFDISMLNKPL